MEGRGQREERKGREEGKGERGKGHIGPKGTSHFPLFGLLRLYACYWRWKNTKTNKKKIKNKRGEITYSPAEGKCRGSQFYDKKEAICEGTYGTVWVAIEKQTGEQVALKQLKNTIGRNGFPYYMLREILFLRRLKHENVVSGREVVCKHQRDSTLEFYIVMEYISFDMRDLWFAQKDNSAHPPWNEANIKHLVLQLLCSFLLFFSFLPLPSPFFLLPSSSSFPLLPSSSPLVSSFLPLPPSPFFLLLPPL